MARSTQFAQIASPEGRHGGNAGRPLRLSDFGSIEGTEKMHHDDVEILKIMRELAVKSIEARAEELRGEAEEAERVRAESRRRQNLSPLEAKVERLERALAYQGAELSKLRGVQSGFLPGLPHVARAVAPQMLGLPGGM